MLGLLRSTNNMLSHILSTDIALGPVSESLTEWGLSHLHEQKEVQTSHQES
jgi:hypothetical protein